MYQPVKQVIQSQTISCELAQLHSAPSVRRGHIWPKLSIRHPWWGKQTDLHHDLAHFTHVYMDRHRPERMLLQYRYYTALLKLKWQCSFQRESVICLACALCLQCTHPYINNSSLHHRSKEDFNQFKLIGPLLLTTKSAMSSLTCKILLVSKYHFYGCYKKWSLATLSQTTIGKWNDKV